MKRTLLFITSIIVSTGLVFGQVTITSDDFPAPGDIYEYASAENPGSFDLGSPGPNQTWDFTGLVPDFNYSSAFSNPGSTPFGFLFPDANIASSTGDTMFTYMMVNSSKASTVGMVIESMETGNFVANYVPEQLIANFPVNYQDEWTSEYYFEFFLDPGIPGIDSTRYKSDVSRESMVDAWGTVSLPMSNYSALRIKQSQTSVDSSWAKIAGVWMLQFSTTTNSYNYEWWTNESPVSPFIASVSSPDNFATLDGATWLTDAVVGIDDRSASATLKIYPNPATDHLFIRPADDGANHQFRIISSSGQMIVNRTIEAGKEERIDVSGLATGLYQYILVSNKDNTFESGTISVTR